jgi:hypothetical protein
VSDIQFFNPYLKQQAEALRLSEGRYWLRHADDGAPPVGFVATTILVGVPASLLHEDFPTGRTVEQLAYEVIGCDSGGFEYTGWVMRLSKPATVEGSGAVDQGVFQDFEGMKGRFADAFGLNQPLS